MRCSAEAANRKVSALTGTERQSRYRQRQAANRTAPARRLPRPIRQASRPQQWHAAVATLLRLQAEYAAWLDALPEALRDDATGQALETIVELDLDDWPASSRRAALGETDCGLSHLDRASPTGGPQVPVPPARSLATQ